MEEELNCKWCDCPLGSIKKQEHDNPEFAEYRECIKCGYQWAKRYWHECRPDTKKEVEA